MTNELPPAPPALDAGNGRPVPSGRYRGAIADLSTAAWDGGGRRRLQRKGWMYLSASTARHAVGFAIVDAGLVATAFVYLFDRQTGRLIEEKAAVPFGFPAGFAPDWRGHWQLAQRGRHWRISPRENGGWRCQHSGPQLDLQLDVDAGGSGLTAVSSAPGRPFAHTWKLCALDSALRFTVDGQTLETPSSSAVDFTLGYPPRSTLWNWASLDGRTDDGRRVGLNLVAHFNNGLENALWLDGELQPLAQACFDYDCRDLTRPWRVSTVDGVVDLRFTPDGQRAERLNALLLKSRFAQPFGRFEGRVGPDRVSGFGVVEEHAALW